MGLWHPRHSGGTSKSSHIAVSSNGRTNDFGSFSGSPILSTASKYRRSLTGKTLASKVSRCAFESYRRCIPQVLRSSTLTIYFEDAPLTDIGYGQVLDFITIDAADGVSANLSDADMLLSHSANRRTIVYTNSILLLDGKYSWDSNRKKHFIYLRDIDGGWSLIQGFTSRELRFGHNIPHLYLGGEFGNHLRS